MMLFPLGNGTDGSPHDNSCCKPYIQEWNWCKCCGQDHWCGLQYLCVPDFKKCYGNQELPILPTSHKNTSETQEKDFWCYLKKKPSCCPQASFDRLKKIQDLCGKSGRVTNECTDQDQDPCRKE